MHDSFAPVESVSIDATRLPWLCNEYLNSLRGKTAPTSIQKYKQKIAHFLRWSKPFQRITESEMFAFAAYLAGSGLKETTQDDVVLRCGQMFRWAHRSGIAKQDYSLWLPVLNAAKPIFKPVSVDDVQALLYACTLTRYALRNQAMIAVMAGSGLRLEETVSLNVEDLTFYADNSAGVAVRSGKGKKSRVVHLPAMYGACVRAWVDAIDAGPVFTSQKGERLTACGAHNEFKKIAAKANLKVSCHDMRRHFATQWIVNHPGRYAELQQQMGHSDFSTTASYIWLTADHVRSLVDGG